MATWRAMAGGRPSRLPFCRAFRRPALTLSGMSERSNSAMAAHNLKHQPTRRRAQVEVVAQADKRDANGLELGKRVHQVPQAPSRGRMRQDAPLPFLVIQVTFVPNNFGLFSINSLLMGCALWLGNRLSPIFNRFLKTKVTESASPGLAFYSGEETVLAGCL
jgi:hypothetical protein